MTVQDYLLKFRKISSLESLEKLFDHLNYTLTDDMDIVNMYRAADHRRAELVSGGRLFDVGQYRHVVLYPVVDDRILQAQTLRAEALHYLAAGVGVTGG